MEEPASLLSLGVGWGPAVVHLQQIPQKSALLLWSHGLPPMFYSEPHPLASWAL